MTARRFVLSLLLLFSLLVKPVSADGVGSSPSNSALIPGEAECSPRFPEDIVAPLYSYQVPIVIRNEVNISTQGDIWAFGDACVKLPADWTPSQVLSPYLREGKTWTSLAIYQRAPLYEWQASFPPNERERREFSADNLVPLGSGNVYVPTFGSNLAVSLENVPDHVVVGVSQKIATTLREAGMIVEDGRVWVEYSNHPKAREGRNLKPFKAIQRWASAYSLLCEPGTQQKRTDNNADLARTLMVRNPAFPWQLAENFDCRNSSDRDELGRRKWGGGIVVLDLFPNLELAPLEVKAQDAFVNVGIRLKNQSPVAGPVHLYYRWDSTGVWKRYETTLTLKPYQNTSRGEAVDSFVMRLPGPENPDKLTVLVWPDSSTGLATSDPNLGLVTSAVLEESNGLDRVLETYTRELTLRDNTQSAAVQPVFCGDLAVSVNAPESALADGFSFTVTATRQGCESLTKVIIDATVNGITQRQEAVFRGQTAVTMFESGPQYGEGRAWIRAVVDPDNLVRESNEANNRAERSVVLEEDWLDEIVCPYGEPPEKCFRSRLYN